jgi:hypothetical protein
MEFTFNNDVPLDLSVQMGAGKGTLRLRDLTLTKLHVEMGAGQVEVDLTGDRKNQLDADIEGGVASVRGDSITMAANIPTMLTVKRLGPFI